MIVMIVMIFFITGPIHFDCVLMLARVALWILAAPMEAMSLIGWSTVSILRCCAAQEVTVLVVEQQFAQKCASNGTSESEGMIHC